MEDELQEVKRLIRKTEDDLKQAWNIRDRELILEINRRFNLLLRDKERITTDRSGSLQRTLNHHFHDETTASDLVGERCIKIRRVRGPVECNVRVRCLTQIVNDVIEETQEIDGAPDAFMDRYSIPVKFSLYCRKCYSSLYSYIKKEILRGVYRPVMLIGGVPGIGKSFFSLYFFIQIMLDETFPVKECFFEYEKGMYHKFTLISREVTNVVDPDSEVKWITHFRFRTEKCNEIDGSADLVLSDISDLTEPRKIGRWTFIFSSPNPLRYKQTMKVPSNYHLTMPTWSEQELQMVNENIIDWYDRFVIFGGVPRFVFWVGRGTDPLNTFQAVWSDTYAVVIEYFFTHRFSSKDSEAFYMLVHINPPWLPEQNDWDYLGLAVHSFASDEIFRMLSEMFQQILLNNAVNVLKSGLSKGVYGYVFAGNLFEKVVLWLNPIAGQTVTLRSLTDHTELVLTLPPSTLLPRNWKATDKLTSGLLYQPRISNLESSDCFGIIQDDDKLVLIVLQMTVSETHPIKVNRLREIVRAYPLHVQNALSKKVIGFVIPVNGGLNSAQPLHTQEGKVIQRIPIEVECFEQYVCHYTISNEFERTSEPV